MQRSSFAAAMLGAMLLSHPALANDEVIKLSSDPNNWAQQNGDHALTRYSKLDQINTSNVKDLKVAWTFSTGVLRGHEGSPLVIGNVLYAHTPFPNVVYALDLDDEQKILWKYEPKQDPSVIAVMCCDTVNRGVAYADGKIFLYQADTHLVALDAKTGKEVWKTLNGDVKRGETGTSAPVVANDKVIVGISGAEFGVQGYLSAYNIKDGSLAWKAYNVGPDDQILFDADKTTSLGKPVGKDSSIKTWTGDQWKIGGATTWGWYSFDPKLNLVYYGTGNPSTWNPAQRAGPDGKPIDQKWSLSIIARNVDTGVAAWAYQLTPFDEWDYDGVNESILVDDVEIKGKKHNVLVHFDRNGFAYTLDRESGIPLVAEKYDPAVNWSTGVDLDPKSATYGRPKVVEKYSTFLNGPDVNTKGVVPAARRCRCSLRRAPTTSATSSPGITSPARSSGRRRSRSPCGRARWRRRAGLSSTARSKATSRPWIRRTARSCSASRHRPASSATRSPIRTRASSTSASTRASAAGPASVSRPVSTSRRTASAPSADTLASSSTRPSAAL